MIRGSAGLLATLLLVGAAGRASPATEARRPNILFIFADDHAYQAIGAYNDPRRLIDTPHIDRLAREGIRFDRCVNAKPAHAPDRRGSSSSLGPSRLRAIGLRADACDLLAT